MCGGKSWTFKTSDLASSHASTTYSLCDLETVSVSTSVKWEKQYSACGVVARLWIINACTVPDAELSATYTVALRSVQCCVLEAGGILSTLRSPVLLLAAQPLQSSTDVRTNALTHHAVTREGERLCSSLSLSPFLPPRVDSVWLLWPHHGQPGEPPASSKDLPCSHIAAMDGDR